MAKSANPIDVYRRQQRKKELKKNKTSRTKARDAQVAATKSLDEIKSEIAKLERRQNRSIDSTGSALDANDTKKLERLRKELKIVQAEAGKRKLLADQAQLERDRELISAQRTVEGVKQLNESKYSLVERFASVYYDPNLNPFGAPAPGQPRLYFADPDGRTTTMDSNLAIVPLRLRPKFDEERGITNEGTGSMGNKRRWDQREESTHPLFPPPPVPKREKPTSPPPKHESRVEQKAVKEAVKEEKKEIDLSKPPPLPAPSKSVLRAAKRGKKNSMVDIWASQDELVYEQAVGGGSMEGIFEQEATKEEHIPRWKRDRMKKSKQNVVDNGDVYDPVNPSSTGYADYRNKDQIERQSKQVSKLQKEQMEHAEQLLAAHDAEKQETIPVTAAYTASTAIWYYKDNTSGSLQGPFSAEQMLGWKSFFTSDTPVRFGHSDDCDFIELSQVDFSKPALPPILEKDNPETLTVETLESPVNELGSQTEGIEAESEPGERYIDEEGDEEACIPPNSDDEDEGPEVDMCVPPDSDDDDDEDDSDALPTQEAREPQPSEDENDAICQPYYDVAYPADDTNAVPYPVDIEYPVADDLVAVAYPISDDVGFGPREEENEPAPAAPSDGVQVAPKKKYTGDKEVVGFMPSHLRKKSKK